MAEQEKSKGGRPRKYTPDALAAKFDEYRAWAKNNPKYSYKATSDGGTVAIPLERPLTLMSFCVFANIIRETFNEYEKLDEFSAVCARVRAEIEADQLEGAMVELYNPSIASRVLKLADRQDITTDGKAIQSQPTAIHLVYNNEEIDITAEDVD